MGLRPSQVAPLELPSVAFKPLSRKDVAVARGFLNTPFIQVRMVFGRVVTESFDGLRGQQTGVLQSQACFREEVEMWLQAFPWKVELEALHLLGFGFMTQFLQQMIVEGNYI